MAPVHGAPQPAPSAPPAPPRADAPITLTWPFAAQMATALIVTACVFYALGRWSVGWHETPATFNPKIDLNRATRAELRLVPGFGDSLAQRVVQYRTQHGPFRGVDDLRQVAGIGPKTLERVRHHFIVTSDEPTVECGDAETVQAEMKTHPGRLHAPSKKEAQLTGPIAVNSATREDLQKLPGIGPKLSQRILDERAKATFSSVDDLRRVPGIGPKTVEKLRPLITLE